MNLPKLSLALASVLMISVASPAVGAQREGRLACKAWSGVVRTIAASQRYPLRAAEAVVEGSERVDPRLHRALSLTLRGVYSGNPGIIQLALDPAGWTEACVEIFSKTPRSS